MYGILEDLALKTTGFQALPEAPVVGSNHQHRLFVGMRRLNRNLHSWLFFTSGGLTREPSRKLCSVFFVGVGIMWVDIDVPPSQPVFNRKPAVHHRLLFTALNGIAQCLCHRRSRCRWDLPGIDSH